MRYLTLAIALCACAPEPGTDTGTVDEPSTETIVLEDGDRMVIDLYDYTRWDVIACDDGICADVTHKVIAVDGVLCGLLPFDGYDYVRELPFQEECAMVAEGYSLTVTLWAAG